ncbi:MAG TPA: lysophospholipid acyltransferase family protein [Kouleothrix sp.]|nr:lysophospholipid acyltransferase family protein [Kouleothrix sp.]
MKRGLARLLLRLMGWRVVGAMPPAPKVVLVVAPHTSNWDFPIMLLLALALGIKAKWMGKHTLFRPPVGWFLRRLGGVPIDRTARHNVVGQAVAAFDAADRMVLAVLPEGTRKRTAYWKSGFYYIAQGAQVPIVLGFADYQRKEGGIGSMIIPSGDMDADMAKLRAFYTGITGRHPEQFGEVRLKPPLEGPHA